MKPNVPYAILVPFAVVAFAIGWMIWSMAGTSSGTAERTTTGSAYTRSNEQPVRAPVVPNNDAASDSARSSKGPQTNSR